MNAGVRRRPELYQAFFEDVLLPNLQAKRQMWDWRIHDHAPGWGWVNIQRIELDLWMGVGFTGENNLRIDLHIGRNVQKRYPHLYGELCARRPLLEEALGLTLKFTAPGSGGSQVGRVEVDCQGTIEEAQKDSNHIVDWTILNVISFRSAFTSHLKELLS